MCSSSLRCPRRRGAVSLEMLWKKRICSPTVHSGRTMPVNLDIDVLRTLVVAHDLGAFNRAAKTIGRSQSAVSQQVSKLEDRLGLELFRKEGRGLIPTEAGEIVLGYARRIIDLNDEAVAILKSSDVNGSVRLGFPSDFADHWLPTALGRFKRSHPKVRIEATVDRNVVLADRLEKGQLDLIMLLTETTRFEGRDVSRPADGLDRPSEQRSRSGGAGTACGSGSAVHVSRRCHSRAGSC